MLSQPDATDRRTTEGQRDIVAGQSYSEGKSQESIGGGEREGGKEGRKGSGQRVLYKKQCPIQIILSAMMNPHEVGCLGKADSK